MNPPDSDDDIDDPYSVNSYNMRAFYMARAVLHEYHRISTATLQRRLCHIGYNRVAALLERMEAEGLVGAIEADKRRRVRISVQ